MNNVILIVIDCLRKDYAYDKKFMPYLNNKCYKKIENAITNCTTTWGAMPTLMTGFMPFSVSEEAGINDRIKDSYLAKIAKEMGFATYGITGNNVTSHYYGYDYMFDYFLDFLPKTFEDNLWRTLEKKVPKLKENFIIKKISKIIMKIKPPITIDLRHKIRGNQILENLKNIDFDKNKKNFLFLHFMEPHRPYAPLGRVDKERKKITKTNIKAFADAENLSLKEKEYIKGLFKEEVYDSDTIIHDTLDYIKEKLNWGESLCIVIADHGESLGETDYFGHVGHKLNNPNHINIPIFFFGGIAKNLKFLKDMNLLDIYYLIKSILTNEQIKYKRHKICVGHKREIKPEENWLRASHFISSYFIPETNMIFESQKRLNKENVPAEITDIYFKDIDKKEINGILDTIKL